MSEINWSEDATLYIQLPVAGGANSMRALQLGPLKWVVELALSGRFGPLSLLLIETESGIVIDSRMLEELAQKLDRDKPGGT